MPTPPDDGQGEPEGVGDELQGRGAAAPEPRASKPRRKRAPIAGETRGRKLHLPDDVHDRLWLLARQRRTSVSTVATEILDRNLPRFTVQREG
jgi:hypothetical protein